MNLKRRERTVEGIYELDVSLSIGSIKDSRRDYGYEDEREEMDSIKIEVVECKGLHVADDRLPLSLRCDPFLDVGGNSPRLWPEPGEPGHIVRRPFPPSK